MGKVVGFDKELVHSDKKIAIYGMSPCGQLTQKVLEMLGGGCSLYIDRLAREEIWKNVPVKRFEDITDINEYMIINCASSAFWDIAEFLFEQGVETVYHALPLLEIIPPDRDNVLEMYDTRQKYEHAIKKEENDDSIYRLSIVITERCSLQCKYCTEYVPYIRQTAEHMEIGNCKKALEKLLDALGKLESVMIQGGEVFTHPRWDELVEWCCEESRIGKVIILTNSTIVPDRWEVMQNEKVLLTLDDYEEASFRLHELEKWAEERKIHYTIMRHEFWYDVSDCQFTEENEKELGEKFSVCQLKGCWVISDHFLYRCTATYYKMKYMLSKTIEDDIDFIDLFKLTPAEIRGQIVRLNSTNYLSACRYCVGTSMNNLTGVGEQIQNG